MTNTHSIELINCPVIVSLVHLQISHPHVTHISTCYFSYSCSLKKMIIQNGKHTLTKKNSQKSLLCSSRGKPFAIDQLKPWLSLHLVAILLTLTSRQLPSTKKKLETLTYIYLLMCGIVWLKTSVFAVCLSKPEL